MSEARVLRAESVAQDDEGALALLGKKQVLKRRFGFLSMFGFAVCELITWETVLAIFSQAFDNGGPAGAMYGFVLAWSSTLSVYTVISELASLAPIAGGQYYWVYMLAPPDYKTVFSYVIGWLTSLAWIATVATEILFAGTIIRGILILDYPDSYDPQPYQGTLLTWLVICVCIFINVIIPNWLPRLEVFTLFFHILGFIAIVATLWALTPQYTPSHVVWTETINGGGWPTTGVSLCVGFLGNVATFVGADASVHMAEEVSNAALNIPRAILGAMLINGAVGFIMMVTTLYCLGDIHKVLYTATGYPFIQIFKDSVGSTAGATVMSALVLCLTWVCATGILTTASRMTWSFARDNGLPASNLLSKVNPKTKIPVAAVLTVSIISALLTLIYIGSYTAFADVISLTITGFYGSYFLPALLLLIRRVKKQILPHGTTMDSSIAPGGMGDFKFEKSGDSPQAAEVPTSENASKIKAEGKADMSPPESNPDVAHGSVLSDAPLIWGPWHVPEPWGTINNVYACMYMIFVIFWSVWPPYNNPSVSEMNYSVVVTGGVMILSAAWYFIRARKVYKGPTVDDEVVEAVVRHGSVVSVS